jgi:hypothetical protein
MPTWSPSADQPADQHNADVLDGVMLVDIEVARRS